MAPKSTTHHDVNASGELELSNTIPKTAYPASGRPATTAGWTAGPGRQRARTDHYSSRHHRARARSGNANQQPIAGPTLMVTPRGVSWKTYSGTTYIDSCP